MAIARNEIHVRSVKCLTALKAQPKYFAFMPEPLRTALESLVGLVGPALAYLAHQKDKALEERLTAAETVIENSRDLAMQIQDGIRYQYRHHPDELRKLAPLNCGTDAAETGVRLATLARELPGCTPAFVWLPGEHVTLAAVKKQIELHGPAAEVEAACGAQLKGALKTLREQRPVAHKLWDSEGLGLEGWVIAIIPKNEQFAFGLERRKLPRAAKPTPPNTNPPPAPQNPPPAPAPAPAPVTTAPATPATPAPAPASPAPTATPPATPPGSTPHP